MGFNIDLDRGVHMRSHPTLGMDVYMYVDDPGVYYTAHGTTVAREIAEQAGFPVEQQDREHKIKVALEKAQAEVLEGFGEAKSKVVAERLGFKVMDIGMGRFNVLSPDGDLLNKMPIPREQADMLLKHLAPEVEVE